MTRRRKVAAKVDNDPWPYEGPLRRADGRAPFNHYLWPLDDDLYYAADAFDHWRVSSRFEFHVVALNDGRWSTEGAVYCIEKNSDCYRLPCVFATREQAMRHAVARFIRLCRGARRWDGFDHLTDDLCERLIGWALGILGQPAPKLYRAPPPPMPPPTTLLEIMEAPT